ncbi:hypothetical protein cyc_08044 [Cyclospora cayetanensis]|uniref:Uncharacterized protein n=1 Tax=Cyclospora cayetanensis TaxID=88456 RepID=A0A1D3CVJ6_9EIME|nr:hypothetical protein cyc_08044 [Cyclospora cayetanensis]
MEKGQQPASAAEGSREQLGSEASVCTKLAEDRQGVVIYVGRLCYEREDSALVDQHAFYEVHQKVCKHVLTARLLGIFAVFLRQDLSVSRKFLKVFRNSSYC